MSKEFRNVDSFTLLEKIRAVMWYGEEIEGEEVREIFRELSGRLQKYDNIRKLLEV